MKENYNEGLSVASVKKFYPDFTLDVSFSIAPGEFLSLVGPSGCGKSTTLSLISGLITPDEGSIYLNGKDISSIPIWKRSIGMVFQDYALFHNMDTAKNIGYGLKVRKEPKERINKEVTRLLNLVNLNNYGHRSVENLSGGEKQRTALARALAPEPELLLLDEPLSALDEQLRKSLRREIRSIQQKLGITTLYVTHDQEEALSLSDRVIIMHNGHIDQSGTPEEIYHYPATPFSAEFFGRSTLIPAEVVSHKLSHSLIQSGSEQFKTAPLRKSISKNSRGFLFFRPENGKIINEIIRFPELELNKNFFISAKVTHAEFIGTGYTVELSWQNHRITVLNEQNVPLGTEVTVKVPTEACWFIQEANAKGIVKR